MRSCSSHRSILVRKLSKAGKPQYTHQCQVCLKIDRQANGGGLWVKPPADSSDVPPWVDSFDDGEQLLFPIAPEGAPEDVKAPRSHRVVAEAVVDDEPQTAKPEEDESGYSPYIASLDGHVKCPGCGEDQLDIEEVRGRKGQNDKWLVRCSWGCGLGFVVDPVPGILSDNKSESDEYRLKGMWRKDLEGLTIAEAFAKNEWAIRTIATTHRSAEVRRRITEFLETQG